MSFSYSATTLSKDVEVRFGYVMGRRNIRCVIDEIDRRRKAGHVDPELVRAAEELLVYFDEIRAGITDGENALIERQELEGEFFDDGPEADALDGPEHRFIQTTISHAKATQHAKLIGELTRPWW